MKAQYSKLKLLATLAVLLSSPAFSAEDPTLLSTWENQLLSQLDNDCTDTWCDGEFNFEFNRLTCNPGGNACTLLYDVIGYYPATRGAYSDFLEERFRLNRLCTLPGFSDLTPAVRDRISRCAREAIHIAAIKNTEIELREIFARCTRPGHLRIRSGSSPKRIQYPLQGEIFFSYGPDFSNISDDCQKTLDRLLPTNDYSGSSLISDSDNGETNLTVWYQKIQGQGPEEFIVELKFKKARTRTGISRPGISDAHESVR